ncbi:MAG: acyl-CoA dehydrogenase family protein [Chloroflexi bacterium]|nr:acyl-CoA dehydrogenase family protein [Chloroflexota bacterium]
MQTGMAIRGGSFLTSDISPSEIFTPEDVTRDQLMIMKIAQDFVQKEVKPHIDRLLQQDLPLNRSLMLKAGQQGLLGADIDQEYEGKGLDKIASTLIVAASTGADVFSITWNAHSGIGTLPIVIFGNESQKEKYLPGLARGTSIAAYALTEPAAGSDALSIQTRAVLSPDGKHYVLNGEKIFISNAGLADVFIAYAKVDGDKFTALVVERGYPGISIGPEIKKMGIRGSSTATVFFKGTPVPAENVLYEIGRGYEVAFCILDLGRFRLAVACTEMGKIAIEHSVRYAKQRVQFGKPISQFGLIQQKLANMAIKTYISESMVYRTTGLLKQAFSGVDKKAPDYGKQMYGRISEFTVEYSISKVFASEALSDIVDEAVQIYGGRGYIEGNPAERMYRDSRINRIFEGTNEINQLLMVRWLLRKATAGEIPLFPIAQQLMSELPAITPVSPGLHDGPLGYQQRLLDLAKKIFILIFGAAARKYGAEIENEEEILGYLSNIMIEIFAMENGLLRAMKSMAAVGEEKSALKIDMARVYVSDAMRKIEDCSVQVLAAIETGDAPTTQLASLRKLARLTPIDTISARRRIAAAVIDAEKYVC